MPIWSYKSRLSGFEFKTELCAWWEVNLSSMSGEYSPDEISAEELFGLWEEQVRESGAKNGQVSIHWYVVSLGNGPLLSFMPFQYGEFFLNGKTFLDHHTWPLNVETAEPLNWLALPVHDLRWNEKHADKGGFIQEVTGWKPSILQPSVPLACLTEPYSAYRRMLGQ